MMTIFRKPSYVNYGQVSVEYFVLFAVIVSLTLLSLSSFFSKVEDGKVVEEGKLTKACENFFQGAIERILED